MKNAKNRIVMLLLPIILLGGFFLRYHDYATWPREGATFDEYAWVWLGMNMIQKGVPISWSPHPQYKIRTHYIQRGARFWLVQPYLEHPPLFGLIAGGYAILRGTPDMYHVRLQLVRELALILGVASIYLVYLLGSRVYSGSVGLWSAGIYAVIPTVAVGSRLLQNENFFIPLFLATLYCTFQYLERKSAVHFASAVVLSGLATLAKVPWVAAAVSVTFLLLFSKKYLQVLYLWGGVLAFFSLFIVFGMAWDKRVFIALWNLQLHRYDLGFDSIFALFNQPYLVDRFFTDGWIYAGWGAFLLLLAEKTEKHKYVIFGLLGYFMIYAAGIPNEPGHGWYRYPFYPFLAFSLGYLFSEYAFSKRLIIAGILFFVGLSLLSHTWAVALGFSYAAYRGYILWSAFGALPVWFRSPLLLRISNASIKLQFVFVLLFSILTIWGYNEQ